MKNNFLHGLALMVGYSIGVGMFGLPFVASRAGILSFVFFLILLAFIQYLLYLVYGNIILKTKTFHRLPGYAEIYLGKKSKHIAFIVKTLGNYAALLAYIIITGIFLNQLLSPYFGGNEFIYASILFFAEVIILFFGIGMMAKAEIVMSFLLLLTIALISFKGFDFIRPGNYEILDWQYAFLTYGAMLMALDALGAMPMIARIVNRDEKTLKKIMFLGILIPALVILVFVFVIVGISGTLTSPDAISGVKLILNDGVIFFSLIFGVLTMVTSFLGVAQSLKETFWWDYKMGEKTSWALAVFIPYLMYVVGFKDLISVIGFAGAVAGGISSIIMILVFKKLIDKKVKLLWFKKKPCSLLIYFLITLFISGACYEIYYFIFK
jgi:tyrosine-specific transport protein